MIVFFISLWFYRQLLGGFIPDFLKIIVYIYGSTYRYIKFSSNGNLCLKILGGFQIFGIIFSTSGSATGLKSVLVLSKEDMGTKVGKSGGVSFLPSYTFKRYMLFYLYME